MVSSTEARAERLRRRRAATQGELARGACPSRSEPSGGSRLLRELHGAWVLAGGGDYLYVVDLW